MRFMWETTHASEIQGSKPFETPAGDDVANARHYNNADASLKG